MAVAATDPQTIDNNRDIVMIGAMVWLDALDGNMDESKT